MAKKEDYEYVLLEDLPTITSNFNSVSQEIRDSINKTVEHVSILKDKHDALALAQEQATELNKLIRRLDGFFVKDVVKHEERPLLPVRKELATKEEKEFTVKNQSALKNIQHNLEELKKHLNLL